MTRFYHRVWNALEAEGVEHTIHWGKMYDWTPERLRNRVGQDRLDRWVAARSQLLPASAQRRAFQNAFLVQAGVGV